jgi:hypothetical protein
MRRAETQRTWRVWVLMALLGLAVGSLVRAEPPAGEALPRVTLLLPAELHAGQHALLTIEVELPAHAGKPLLLTPFHEGEAIEVVRGRLLRSDARDPLANPLRFELPMLAHAAGAAVVGVKLLVYLCEAQCRAVEIEARRNLVVLPP